MNDNITEINKDTFWALIQEAKDTCGQDTDAWAKYMIDRLAGLGPDQSLMFLNYMDAYKDLSFRYGLWDAAKIFRVDGCSDDSFSYFRSWLIVQGKDVYMAALADPDSLADVEPYADCFFETAGYVVNGDKTEEQVLTAAQGCSIKSACAEMQDAKIRWNKTDGVQLYHIIQSFRPGEIEPELALEIAQEFVREHLPGYQAVIGIHTDREHIHAHIAFNSINQLTGEKYHSNARSYYQQIRAISDRLCREHGLSVIVRGAPARSVSYIEWLRQSKGQPAFRSMLEADLRDAIRDANDLGHFFLLMEHKGYEIHHGGRLGFRLRGQERFQCPGRRDPLFTEDGIRAAIQGNLEQIEAGLRPVLPARLAYQPYRKHPRYSGFLALYVHYLYLLGKIEKRQYPPRMTPHLRQAVMRFERYQAQFAFLRENDITTPADMAAFEHRTEETLGRLTRQRTLLNVRKKKRQLLYAALADAEALEPSRALYEEGLTGMEQEFEQYMKAVKLLEDSGIPQEVLKKEKAELYEQLSEVNRKIRAEREKLKLCREICQQTPAMEQDIQKTEEHQKEVREHEHRRR